MTGTLIIGYGNLLRGDDAVGCHAAHELEQHYRDDPEVEVIATQQLTPEMAEDVSRCGFVLFLDASSAEKPGTIRQSRVLPGKRSRRLHPPTDPVRSAVGRAAALWRQRRKRSASRSKAGRSKLATSSLTARGSACRSWFAKRRRWWKVIVRRIRETGEILQSR